jgi:hypothetical protein
MPLILETVDNKSGEIAQALIKALNNGDAIENLILGLTPEKLPQRVKKALKRAAKEKQVIQFDLFESIDKMKYKQYRVVIDFFTAHVEVCKISQPQKYYFDSIEVIDEPSKRANQSETNIIKAADKHDSGEAERIEE